MFNILSRKNKDTIKIAIVFSIFLLSGFFAILSYRIKKNEIKIVVNPLQRESHTDITVPKEEPIPEPEAFVELTIPYLRDRKYESKIGELTYLDESDEYYSYLTSYDSDGLKINGLLTIPKEAGSQSGWPGIVFVHGYIPPDSYKTTENYSSYVDYLAKNGFVVFKIDLRGHGESEGEPGGAYYSSDYVVDILNAYSALQSSDFVDKDNIGLWGHSMGGNVVFRSFVAKQDIKAVSIWAGAVYTYEDFQEYSISDGSYRPPSEESESRKKRNELFETYGTFNSENDFWKKVVPTNFLEGIGGVVQLNHSVDDPVVSVRYARNLSSILMSTNIKYEVNEYPSGGHNITGDTFNQAMQDTVDFFKEHLVN
ncbi:alpha/beta fold hydrolase [Patescibacteria group bacterium]|nr:alpha/beta fold hydrolase [Patescibacteria group bacterium]